MLLIAQQFLEGLELGHSYFGRESFNFGLSEFCSFGELFLTDEEGGRVKGGGHCERDVLVLG